MIFFLQKALQFTEEWEKKTQNISQILKYPDCQNGVLIWL